MQFRIQILLLAIQNKNHRHKWSTSNMNNILSEQLKRVKIFPKSYQHDFASHFAEKHKRQSRITTNCPILCSTKRTDGINPQSLKEINEDTYLCIVPGVLDIDSFAVHVGIRLIPWIRNKGRRNESIRFAEQRCIEKKEFVAVQYL